MSSGLVHTQKDSNPEAAILQICQDITCPNTNWDTILTDLEALEFKIVRFPVRNFRPLNVETLHLVSFPSTALCCSNLYLSFHPFFPPNAQDPKSSSNVLLYSLLTFASLALNDVYVPTRTL